MAAPNYVPTSPDEQVRVYESPPWNPDPWVAHRPSDLRSGQPRGPLLGDPGPDQGYSLLLARRFRDALVLSAAEDVDDAIAGCVAVANKRASLFGRAPMIHDLTVAFTLWGFLADADPSLVAAREQLFAAAALGPHYAERRRIADAVPAELLRKPHTEIVRLCEADATRSGLLDL